MTEKNEERKTPYCIVCDGAGIIHTGIFRNTQCRFCDGTGYAAPAPSASPVYDQSVVKRLATQMGWTPTSASPAALTILRQLVEHIDREGPPMHEWEIVSNLCDQARALLAAQPAEPAPKCATCNDNGMIGGHFGQTPESYEEWAEPCPDCAPAEPAPVDRRGVALSDEWDGPLPDLLNEAERIAANLKKTGHYLAANVMRILISRASSSRADVSKTDEKIDTSEKCVDGVDTSSRAEVESLLTEARNHIANPAEGHDDVMLALDLIERIDAMLAAAEAPNGGGKS